jgi:hypothetical protein
MSITTAHGRSADPDSQIPPAAGGTLVDRARTLDPQQLVSLRRSSMRPLRGSAAVIAAAVRLACAGLLVWTGWIHLHLWLEGYRQLPTNGPLFLAAALGAFLLAATLIVLPRPVIGLLGAGFLIAAIGALVISINIGLFGFKESGSASFVMVSLVIESIGAVGLMIWAILVADRH